MAATKITVNTNGSIRVEGDFEIVDPTGKVLNKLGDFDEEWNIQLAIPLASIDGSATLKRTVIARLMALLGEPGDPTR